jgi:Holliday junction resolvase RusA-like endonuclease
MRKVYNIIPIPKCRMTQRDRWLDPPRPSVARYRSFADEVRAQGVQLPESDSAVLFVLPMPKSWSKKKKVKMVGQAHKQKPDLSNLLKALEDAIYSDDSRIWHYRELSKRWGVIGQIIIQIFGEVDR